MEDCHSVKLSRLLALTVLVLNGSLFRKLTLVSYDQDRILDDQDFDPGRGQFHRRVLGDYPLLCENHFVGKKPSVDPTNVDYFPTIFADQKAHLSSEEVTA